SRKGLRLSQSLRQRGIQLSDQRRRFSERPEGIVQVCAACSPPQLGEHPFAKLREWCTDQPHKVRRCRGAFDERQNARLGLSREYAKRGGICCYTQPVFVYHRAVA